MANALLLTNENAINRATILQASLLNSVCRLVQNYVPQYTDNRAVLLANEANYTGYPAGGFNLGNWAGPSLPGTGGAGLTSALVNVAPAGNNTIGNNLTAFWVETIGNAPVTLLTGLFSPSVEVLLPDSEFPLIIQDFEGASVVTNTA